MSDEEIIVKLATMIVLVPVQKKGVVEPEGLAEIMAEAWGDEIAIKAGEVAIVLAKTLCENKTH